MTVHLVKLCVGVQSVEDLERWRAARRAAGETVADHVTRMTPKRRDDVLDRGSLYWVISGHVQARQRILDLEETRDAEGRTACRIVMAPDLIRTELLPKRPFQGWRYLDPAEAPRDIDRRTAGLPPELAMKLKDCLAW